MTNCDVTGTVSKNDARYGADQVIPEEDLEADLEENLEADLENAELSTAPADQEEEEEQQEQPIDFDPIEAEEHSYETEDEDEMIRVYPYDVPRPALTIEEASSILGKSVRSIERSIEGKWGNRLPEGWKARRMKIDGEAQWRIIPPPGFRVRHSSSASARKTAEKPLEKPTPEPSPVRASDESGEHEFFGFSLERLITTASIKARNELVKAAGGAVEDNQDHPTIVIDRSDDVERLLRELADTQKELAEERRLHMEDMRLLAKMQDSMRLLEDRASTTAMLKDELKGATLALAEHKKQYQEFLALPWWKRIFKSKP
ncbi:MAG: hypothetical protein IPM23_26720 [Candidatus Melainabacteria bacterium]|nr:hypothetical protein [Candidatus Melainabacteria bacterium]